MLEKGFSSNLNANLLKSVNDTHLIPVCGNVSVNYSQPESLILAQNERWRQALYMQVERSLRREWQTGE